MAVRVAEWVSALAYALLLKSSVTLAMLLIALPVWSCLLIVVVPGRIYAWMLIISVESAVSSVTLNETVILSPTLRFLFIFMNTPRAVPVVFCLSTVWLPLSFISLRAAFSAASRTRSGPVPLFWSMM